MAEALVKSASHWTIVAIETSKRQSSPNIRLEYPLIPCNYLNSHAFAWPSQLFLCPVPPSSPRRSQPLRVRPRRAVPLCAGRRDLLTAEVPAKAQNCVFRGGFALEKTLCHAKESGYVDSQAERCAGCGQIDLNVGKL